MAEEHEHRCGNPEEFQEKTRQAVENHGHQVLMVLGTDYSPSFAYSIGLFKTYNHPEIICFGLPQPLSGDIINDVVELIKKGENFTEADISLQIFKNSKATFLNVDPRNIGDYFLADIKYHGHSNFPALQLVWTDRNDKFPWDEGFEEEIKHDQPLLDRNADFKFREAENLGIYTSRFWQEKNKPILYVVHDEDGDWQFQTGDMITPDDGCIVALKQMVLRDPTLNQIFDLEYGQYAERDAIGGKWTRGEKEYNEQVEE